jgi:phosphoribosylglycinamide formyltransferase-1
MGASEASGKRTRTAVLISGRGSNLGALIAACACPDAAAEIALALSNRPEAEGIARARAAGVPSDVVDHRQFRTRDEFERSLNFTLETHEIGLVCLAGFMRVLSSWFTERWRDRLLNIHPSLLPAFPGLDTHRRALAAGVRFSGCTVHFVRAEVDAGPIIVQGIVPVRADDTPATLAARVLEAEHRCYPLALELVASGRARLEGDRVVIAGHAAPDAILVNPVPTGPPNPLPAKPRS